MTVFDLRAPRVARGLWVGKPWFIDYKSDDVTKNFFLHFSALNTISVEHDEKSSQPKFGGNRIMGARNMVV